MGETVESLEGLNDTQLREVIQRAEMMLRERGTKRLDELKQLAREAGFEVTLTRIGESESRRGRGKRAEAGKQGRGDRRREVPAKYQNPDNPSDKWSGRERQPKWVQMALAHGRRLEDLAISAA